MYLFFMAMLGLYCFTRAFSSCGGRGYSLVVTCGLLTVVATVEACCRAQALGS